MIQEELFEITYKKNIPLITVFELTNRCNLKCRHCYLPKNDKCSGSELTTEEIKRILSQLKRAGCLHLVLTGGEVFLRDDILDICKYAHKLNFDFRIFSNGNLITEKITRQLAESGISGVEISFYGRESVHDKITGVRGSFEKSINAVNLLKRYKIKVTIKCLLMKSNFNDYPWLIRYARNNGVSYRFDPTVAPKNNGDKSILKHRLSNQQLKRVFGDKDLVGNVSFEDRKGGGFSDWSNDLFCSGGHNSCGIDSYGNVYPCLQLLIPLGNLRDKTFSKIWHPGNGSKLTQLRKFKQDDLQVCNKCTYAENCRRCPGLALLEDGNLLGPSSLSCKMVKVQCDKNHLNFT